MNADLLNVSVHTACRLSGADRFHIRFRVEDPAILLFIKHVVGIALNHDDRPYFEAGHDFSFNGVSFSTEMGEYNSCLAGQPNEGLAWFSVSSGGLWADLTPFKGGWNVDFSVEKDFGAFENLDYARWLDETPSLPPCFWIKPARIMRAILGVGRNQ